MAARRDSNDKEKDLLKGKKRRNTISVDKLKRKSGGSKDLLESSKQEKKRRTSASSSTTSEKDKSQSKTPLKPEASRPSTSTGGKTSGFIHHPHHKVGKSNRSRRPGRPHRRCGSGDESGSETDHEGGLTPESAEQVYSATYLEDYFDSIEYLDGVSRFTSRILQNNCEVLANLTELESAYKQFSGNDEDELDLNNLSQEQKNALFNMKNLLIQTSCSGDLSTSLSEEVANAFDEKLRLLKIDTENLDRVLGKTDNKAPKKGASTLKKVSINPEPLKSSSFRALGSIFDSGRANSMLGSPTPSVSSVSAGDVFNFDESLLEGCTRYRTCKFRNPPQYVPTARPVKTQPPLSQEKTTTSTTEEKVESSKKEGETQLKKCSSNTSVRSGNSGAKRTSAAAAAVLDTSAASSAENSSSEEDEPTYCLCEKESSGKMVGCDNHLCPIEWFHFKCVGLKTKPKGKWYCPKCRGDDFTVMKPRKIFLAELQQYNMEKEKDF